MAQIDSNGNPIHTSDCSFWVDETCDCMMRHDPDLLLDRERDREDAWNAVPSNVDN